MSYAIVYTSLTGNTARLAEALRAALPAGDCLYFGAPDAAALAADTIYAGFWTDKGTCDKPMEDFLRTLTNQKVFLFGTAGFGGAPTYFTQILTRARGNLADTVTLLGGWMCQGKMPQSVRDRYVAMEDSPRRTAMIENFDQALAHPNEADLAALCAAVQEVQ